MSINWQNLRPWNGSQHTAFEELCCQLASCEQDPNGSRFFRKGTPDAGVECFWQFPNRDEWGWQAKFFTSPKRIDYTQIEDSIKKALEKHPSLKKYTVCIATDLSDARVKNKKSALQKWIDHSVKWKSWAEKREMSVDFEYWGTHEIFSRLSKTEHAGRYFFWFNKQYLDQEWFESHISEVVANAGPKYTPELNVELPITQLFNGLGRTMVFYERIKKLYGEIRRAFSFKFENAVEFSKNTFMELQKNLDQIFLILDNIDEEKEFYINFDLIANITSKAQENAYDCIGALQDASKNKPKNISITDNKKKLYEWIRHEQYYLSELIRKLRALESYAQNNQARLANLPALLLLGNAGTGKTHLFCDISNNRIESKLPTLLLLGEQFRDDEPWLQIIRLLGLPCNNKSELLGALETAAQARDTRALILIDALNEGEGKNLWRKFLPGILKTLSRYSRIGIAVSVRTSYEPLVIPDKILDEKLVRDIHAGFAEYEYKATQTFFDYFGIVRPSVPLLIPEFQNPLFLKIFCQGLANLNLSRVPRGLQGITRIFDFFLSSINEKLSRPEYLEFDHKSNLLQKATQKLAKMMAQKGKVWLPREEAKQIVDAYLPDRAYEHSLFRHMIHEGVLAEDIFPGDKKDEWIDGIRFSYERFTDHFIAQFLLNKYLNRESPASAFDDDQPLGAFLGDEFECWRNRGLIEAFSIQLPELIGKELPVVVNRCADYLPVIEAFIDSLVWRDPKAVNDETLQYINEHVLNYETTHHKFLDAWLTISSNPDHYFNADLLHDHLKKFELAERDSWWSTFLHYQYGAHGSVDRLIDWAWSSNDNENIDKECVRLCFIALAWFLTTSNRFLRDRATKALVSLMTNNIRILQNILFKFLNINDPYVLERLFAVAYGCALRSKDEDAIGELAKHIYEWIFKDGNPPIHILTRDYARGVIEVALHRGIDLGIDVEKIKPPYNSEWPDEIPTEKELKSKYYPKDIKKDRGCIDIWASVMSCGDFARYIIGTNSGIFHWSSRRLGTPRIPSKKEIYERFIKDLDDNQRKLWDQMHPRIDISLVLASLKENGITNEDQYGQEYQHNEKQNEMINEFENSLAKKQLKIYREIIIPYESSPYQDEFQFDLSVAQRWIFQKVIDLGWTSELFENFDQYAGRRYREARKTERMGKKYQWIAYHEFLARVSDNFEFKEDSFGDKPGSYDGPWQINVRDFDPSCLLKKTLRETWQPHSNNWWFTISYTNWDAEYDVIEWLKKTEDLPPIEPLIEVNNSENVSQWLVLESYYRWEQLTAPDKEHWEDPTRFISYMLRSYLVKKDDIDELFNWAKEQNFWERWMPESPFLIDVFLGEFFWSPAFAHHNIPYYHHDGWTFGEIEKLPKPVLVTTDQYLEESGTYDCSIDETVNIHLPAKMIADNMNLSWNGVDGHFFGLNGNIIAFDPSINAPGPGALLIRKDKFIEFLNNQGYDILWLVLGEKGIIGSRMQSHEYEGRLELNGIYRLLNGKINGLRNTRFVKYNS